MAPLDRAAGILAHPTSLPAESGIGDIGPSSERFLTFLERAGQRLWQVLPLNPTGYGDSPYASPSALAGNPLLIALEPLVEAGWLEAADLDPLRSLPAERVDFAALVPRKHGVLRSAFFGFLQHGSDVDRQRFAAFRREEAAWLDDYSLFAAMRDTTGTSWMEWEPGLRNREPAALEAARRDLAEHVEYQAFAQWQFFEQWQRLRRRAEAAGVRIVGDLPIFVAQDSADVWANRRLFKLDRAGEQRVSAGVPPDYFSEKGQLWGNPLYDWDAVGAEDYAWWTARFRQLMRLVDVVRIDHFRGFQAAWEVPAGARDARGGEWVEGPGARLFHAVQRQLGRDVPIIAEDLGLITDEVRALLADLRYPGMKVLQFAFGGEPDHPYLPHMFPDANCVIYTGTHDNDTTRGWYASAAPEERDLARRYLGVNGDDIAWDFIRLAHSSTASTAIVPLQDVLDLGSEARMNTPGAAEGNWAWRARADALTDTTASRLRDLTWVYGRLG